MRNKVRVWSVVTELVVLAGLVLVLGFSSSVIFRVCTVYFMIQSVFGHYSIRTLLIWDEAELLVKSCSCFFLTLVLFYPYNCDSLILVGKSFVVSFFMLCFSLVLQRYLRRWFRSSCADRVLIIGEKDVADEVKYICETNRFALRDIRGFIPLMEEDLGYDGVYNFGGLETLIQELGVNSILIAAPNYSRHKMKALLKRVEGVEKISYMPLVDGINFDSRVDDFDGHLLVTTSKGDMSLFARVVKRLIDVCAGLAGCVLLIPLTVYVWFSNRKEGDTDPIFFVQERIGKGGKLFRMFKFRSMVPDAERVLDELMECDPAIREEYLTNKKLANDPRITKAGKFLREKSFDEFPQFVNLLKGDMSLIGPRPYLPREIDDMGSYYKYIVGCKPGITGMWQTHGRSETSFEDRLILDEYYSRNWTLKLDLTILIKTFRTVFHGSGAM